MATDNRFRDTVVGTIEPIEVVLMRGTETVDLSAGGYTGTCKIIDASTSSVVKTAGTCSLTTLGVVRYQPTSTVVATARNAKVEFTVRYNGNVQWRTPAIHWRIIANL